ncbi:ABZJ_00895 family protein [Paracoccus zhejiangensis]|nr:ABZJ_00895 family protein [Paracoccus zhejiangensis]
MTNETAPRASMVRLLVVYFLSAIFTTTLLLVLVWALATYASVDYPVGILLVLVPMLAAMQAGGSYFRQTGQAASFSHAFSFGMIATLLVLMLVIVAFQAGLLDGMLRQIDPAAFDQRALGRILMPLLAVLAGVTLFSNVMLFWAGARSQWKQRERQNRIATRRAGKGDPG